jgi:hypothetical protein
MLPEEVGYYCLQEGRKARPGEFTIIMPSYDCLPPAAGILGLAWPLNTTSAEVVRGGGAWN